jgi:hypothetical protein
VKKPGARSTNQEWERILLDFDKTEPRNHNGSGVLEYCSDAADQLQLKVRRPYLCWALLGLPSSFSAVTVNPLITPTMIVPGILTVRLPPDSIVPATAGKVVKFVLDRRPIFKRLTPSNGCIWSMAKLPRT